MSQGQKFSIVAGSLYINSKAFYIPREDFELLGFLNSQVCWFFWAALLLRCAEGYGAWNFVTNTFAKFLCLNRSFREKVALHL